MRKRLSIPLLITAFCVAIPVASVLAARDRDHDKLPDKWEKRYSLSTKQRSAKRDPDHDRLNNRREYKARTNPRRRDTDRDGLSDYVEVVKRKTNPRRKDTDRDGWSDGAEVRAGTNPRSKADHPPGSPSDPSAVAAPPGARAAGRVHDRGERRGRKGPVGWVLA